MFHSQFRRCCTHHPHISHIFSIFTCQWLIKHTRITTHFVFLITLSSTRSNTHESQHTSRNWSPCQAPYSKHMNHNTLRAIDHLVKHQIKHTTLRLIDHLVEHHIKHTWITTHFAFLITLSSTRSNTHESQHTSLNWSPCRAPYQTHMNHNNTPREIDHLDLLLTNQWI